jgi:putative serine protease PepD
VDQAVLLRPLLLFCLALAPSATGAQSALHYPYLDAANGTFANFREAAERAAAGYVMVTLIARPDPVNREGGGPLHTGSGIILDREGHILTAAHIARGKQFDVEIRLRTGRVLRGEVLRVSPKDELALLKTQPLSEAEPIVWGNSAGLKRGEPALALGSPKRNWGTVSLGRIKTPNIGERLDYGNWGFDNAIEIDMEVESGHSGGPVIDAKGRLIGMVAGYELGDTGKAQYRSPRIAYVVPVNDIRKWLGR